MEEYTRLRQQQNAAVGAARRAYDATVDALRAEYRPRIYAAAKACEHEWLDSRVGYEFCRLCDAHLYPNGNRYYNVGADQYVPDEDNR